MLATKTLFYYVDYLFIGTSFYTWKNETFVLTFHYFLSLPRREREMLGPFISLLQERDNVKKSLMIGDVEKKSTLRSRRRKKTRTDAATKT